MRILLIAAALAIATTLANAGIMPQYQDFMFLHDKTKREIAANQAKLGVAKAKTALDQLEASRKRMETGASTMLRESYYKLAGDETGKVKSLRRSLSLD